MKRLLLYSLVIFTFHSCTIDENPDSSRENFLGDWTCNEFQGDFAPQTYNVEVLASGSGNNVRIIGLYNQGLNYVLSGQVSGNTIYINTQTVAGITISGSGNMNSSFNRVDITFTADDGSGADNVKATWLR